MRFLIDMPLSPALARWLVTRGHQAVHATMLGLDRAPDIEILALAAREAYTVITADLDYPRLLADLRATSPSLILLRDGNWGEAEVIAKLTEVLAALSDAEVAESIIVIERERIRRRRLPLGSKPGS